MTTQLSSCCIEFWGNVYPFTMPGPPGELMTREKLISSELHQKSPTYGHVAKLFLESEFQRKGNKQRELENVFVKHYAPNHMPDRKGEWSLKENNSELHYGICSKVYQFIYTLVCSYMPIMRIPAKAVLQISRSKGCSYTKCLCPKKESNATGKLRNRFKS